MRKPCRVQLQFKGDTEMNLNQIERLKKDERELGHYQQRLIKKGKQRVAHNIQKKREYLLSKIQEVEEDLAAA